MKKTLVFIAILGCAVTLILQSPTAHAIHAVAPGYSVSGNTTDWVSTGSVAGNFTTTVNPYGFLTDIIEAAATAGTTPSQLPFIIMSTVIILLVSLVVTWGFRYMNANGSLFAKGVLCLSGIGMFVATKWWDWWMLIFFVIFFATCGMMSRHQSWQN